MSNSFSSLLNSYLTNYLVIQRNMSSNTIRSYKCTFKLLIKYITDIKNITIKNINFNVGGLTRLKFLFQNRRKLVPKKQKWYT